MISHERFHWNWFDTYLGERVTTLGDRQKAKGKEGDQRQPGEGEWRKRGSWRDGKPGMWPKQQHRTERVEQTM